MNRAPGGYSGRPEATLRRNGRQAHGTLARSHYLCRFIEEPLSILPSADQPIVQPSRSSWRPKTFRSRLKLEFPVDLDRNAVREFGKPDGGACMLAVLRTQQLVEEIRRAVDNLWHPVESWCHIDHSHEPHDELGAFVRTSYILELDW